MTSFTRESLNERLSGHSTPCLSLYQPTHRWHPENHADPIRFRNLLKKMKASLLQNYSPTQAQTFLDPFEALAQDHDFWNHALDGLAVLGAPNFFRAFRLPRAFAELAVVADSFHLKPLWQFVQFVDRYQVLGVSLDGVRLFEGDRDMLEEVELADEVPCTITDVLGQELAEVHQSVSSNGGNGGSSSAVHHGLGGKTNEADSNADRLFRAIDRAVLEHHSRPTNLPLVLAALPEHHHRFRSVSVNPFLLAEGLKVNPNAVTNSSLRAAAWQVFESHYETRLAKRKDNFEHSRTVGRGSDNLAEIFTAAAAGRVATLFIGADRQIPGRLDQKTGKIIGDTIASPRVDDVLDDLGELVGKMRGEVLVIPTPNMPTRKGAAAIYRW